MKQFAILFLAACAMGVMTSESQAQGFSYGSFGGGRGVSLSVGSGFYGPGYGSGFRQWGGPGWGHHAPIYRPVPVYRPVYPIHGGWGGGGWGGGGWGGGGWGGGGCRW